MRCLCLGAEKPCPPHAASLHLAVLTITMATETDIWTIRAALDWTVGYLDRKGDENPRLSAEWLLAEACDMRRIDLYVNYDRPLSMDERDILRGYVTRRGRGEPLQYITGEVGFRHITVRVRPGVLIPRPETEILVSEVLAALPEPTRPRAFDSTISAAQGDALLLVRNAAVAEGQREEEAAQLKGEPSKGEPSLAQSAEEPSPAQPEDEPSKATLLVADLCTGSGCIACSIAHEHPDAFVIATDIAPEAVSLARENAREVGVDERVRVVECSLGEGVDPAVMGSFDAVVSNPPYVPARVLDGLPREVADFEPALALDGGNDGLDVFRPLAAWALSALKPGGFLAVELYEGHLEQAAEVARGAGFADVGIVRDLAGRPRILTARKPASA